MAIDAQAATGTAVYIEWSLLAFGIRGETGSSSSFQREWSGGMLRDRMLTPSSKSLLLCMNKSISDLGEVLPLASDIFESSEERSYVCLRPVSTNHPSRNYTPNACICINMKWHQAKTMWTCASPCSCANFGKCSICSSIAVYTHVAPYIRAWYSVGSGTGCASNCSSIRICVASHPPVRTHCHAPNVQLLVLFAFAPEAGGRFEARPARGIRFLRLHGI